MAFDSPAFCMDSTTQDAQLFRRAVGSLINPAGGIVTPGDLTVTQQSTPNMSVSIAIGQVWIPGTNNAAQGPYYSRNGAAITQNINTSSSSNPRIDTIGVQVNDQNYTGSGGYVCTPLYVPGTPTAGLTTPPTTAAAAATDGAGTVPASSYVIAYVLVPKNATSIVTADIANVATPVTLGPGSPSAYANGLTFTPTTNTAWATLASANLTIATTGQPIFVQAGPITTVLPNAPSYNCFFGFSLDGATPVVAGQLTCTSASQNALQTITPWCVLSPTAGTHTVALQQRTDTNGAAVTLPSYVGQMLATQV